MRTVVRPPGKLQSGLCWVQVSVSCMRICGLPQLRTCKFPHLCDDLSWSVKVRYKTEASGSAEFRKYGGYGSPAAPSSVVIRSNGIESFLRKVHAVTHLRRYVGICLRRPLRVINDDHSGTNGRARNAVNGRRQRTWLATSEGKSSHDSAQCRSAIRRE